MLEALVLQYIFVDLQGRLEDRIFGCKAFGRADSFLAARDCLTATCVLESTVECEASIIHYGHGEGARRIRKEAGPIVFRASQRNDPFFVFLKN